MIEELNNIDKSLMMIFLLEDCNFSCPHCVREDEPMEPGYKLTFEQLKLCLSDCQKLQTVDWVHFSGGEPTLWTDEKRTLADLLLEISKSGFEPGFTTNGSIFDDYKNCNSLLQDYFKNSDRPLRLCLSIDTFHQNYDTEKGRAECLDNVIKFRNDLPLKKKKLLNLTVLATVSKEPKSLLPKEMVEYYKSQEVTFVFIPLKASGKAKSFNHLCPDLASTTQEALGAYYYYYEKSGQNVKNNIVLIGNLYYLPDPWRKIGWLGHLPKKVIEVYKFQ